jgi:hypothetical protein
MLCLYETVEEILVKLICTIFHQWCYGTISGAILVSIEDKYDSPNHMIHLNVLVWPYDWRNAYIN